MTNIASKANATKQIVPMTLLQIDFHDGLKKAGPIVLRKAVQTVKE